MKLKNVEIININYALETLLDQQANGSLVFKLYKLKTGIEDLIKPIQKALEGVDDEKKQADILQEEQKVDLELLTQEDIEGFQLTVRAVASLQPIIEEKPKEEE